MNTHPFYQLYIEMLSELTSIESQIIEILPLTIDTASQADLREALEEYLEETRQHSLNLQKIFEQLQTQPVWLQNLAMQAMVADTRKTALSGGNSSVKDAGLIAMVQRMEHYKMAIYGTVRTFAKHLNHQEVITLLQRALNEESQANKKLIKVAEGGYFTHGINTAACKEKARV